jgi:hypothetical protein
VLFMRLMICPRESQSENSEGGDNGGKRNDGFDRHMRLLCVTPPIMTASSELALT